MVKFNLEKKTHRYKDNNNQEREIEIITLLDYSSNYVDTKVTYEIQNDKQIKVAKHVPNSFVIVGKSRYQAVMKDSLNLQTGIDYNDTMEKFMKQVLDIKYTFGRLKIKGDNCYKRN